MNVTLLIDYNRFDIRFSVCRALLVQSGYDCIELPAMDRTLVGNLEMSGNPCVRRYRLYCNSSERLIQNGNRMSRA